MARANADLMFANVSYQWGHMGMCNCGHLAAWAELLQESFNEQQCASASS